METVRWGGSFEGAKANPSLPASGEKTDAAAQVAALAGRGPRRERGCVDHMRRAGGRRPVTPANSAPKDRLKVFARGLFDRLCFLLAS